MRIAPLAFTKATDQQIREVSAITHAHALFCDACVVYVQLLRDLAGGMPVARAVAKLPSEGRLGRLSSMASVPHEQVKSSGFVVDTFEAAVWTLATTGNYRDCVTAVVELGQDSDTVGAVAGALVGVVYGYDAIPAEWIEALRGKDIIESCLF